MAELAFETIIRVFIAIIMLSLVSLILSSLFQKVEKKVDVELSNEVELPIVVEAAPLKAEQISAYAETCRNYFYENTPSKQISPCFILKDISFTELDKINLSYVEIKRKSINAIMSYDAVRDKVIVE